LNLISWMNLVFDPDTKKSPCAMILSILGCFTEEVPKVLVEISSFLFSKKTGFSIMAIGRLLTFEHFKAIFVDPLRCSTSSLVKD